MMVRVIFFWKLNDQRVGNPEKDMTYPILKQRMTSFLIPLVTNRWKNHHWHGTQYCAWVKVSVLCLLSLPLLFILKLYLYPSHVITKNPFWTECTVALPFVCVGAYSFIITRASLSEINNETTYSSGVPPHIWS